MAIKLASKTNTKKMEKYLTKISPAFCAFLLVSIHPPKAKYDSKMKNPIYLLMDAQLDKNPLV